MGSDTSSGGILTDPDSAKREEIIAMLTKADWMEIDDRDWRLFGCAGFEKAPERHSLIVRARCRLERGRLLANIYLQAENPNVP